MVQTAIHWEQEVLEAPGLIVVLFGAEWCKPCKDMIPILDELGREHPGKVKIVQLDIDVNPEVASMYKISIVPTVIIFKDRQKLHEVICTVSKTDLKRSIEALGG